jgi:hypothetical protein
VLVTFENELDRLIMVEFLLAAAEHIVVNFLVIGHEVLLEIKVVIECPNVFWGSLLLLVRVFEGSQESHEVLVYLTIGFVLVQT